MSETVIERNVNHDTINAVKEIALKKMETIEQLKNQIKEANDMVKETLARDVAYLDASEKVKETTKKATTEKKRIQSSPEMVQLAVKTKDLKAQLKEEKEALSDYLLEYERMSGKDVLETPRGEQLTIFKEAKAVKV